MLVKKSLSVVNSVILEGNSMECNTKTMSTLYLCLKKGKKGLDFAQRTPEGGKKGVCMLRR